MFAGYTVEQVYDELGIEEFFEYIERSCKRIVKHSIDFLKDMELHPQESFVDGQNARLVFYNKQNNYSEMLKVIYFNKQLLVQGAVVRDTGRCIDYMFSNGHCVSKDKIDMGKELHDAIQNECCKSKRLKKRRQELKEIGKREKEHTGTQ